MNGSPAPDADEPPPAQARQMTSATALAQAHLEHAVHELLRQSDLTGKAVALAVRILDVHDILSEATGPAATVHASGGAARSLEAAVRLLVLATDPVTEEAQAELQRILVELNDHGQR